MNQPVISVIVPVYNGERFLSEALQSILMQNYQPLEVLVVDDGSTDQSASVAAKFPEVRVLRKMHSGLAATLNYGIRHATGDLLAFLDADDRWLQGKLAIQVAELLQRPELDMVFGYGRQFNFSFGANSEEEVFSAVQPALHKSAMLIRRKSFFLVGDFSEDINSHDFLNWYARAMAFNIQDAVLQDVVFERRIHNENVGRKCPANQRRKYLSTLRAVINQRRQSAQG